MTTVLITGSGTGMGRLSALSLARAGHLVYASMRDPEGRGAERAQSLVDDAAGASGELRVIELDVLDERSAQRAVDTITADGRLDVVMNNAAHLTFGVAEAFTPEEYLRAFDTNCMGAHRVNRAALPVLRAQREGLLLWIGSGSTRVVPPFLGPYSASKAGLDALAESTAWDVARYGIETTILMPGVFTAGTEHFAEADFPGDTARAEAYDEVAPFIASSERDTNALFPDGPQGPGNDPQIVADEVVRIVGLPVGSRPRRAVADGSDFGAEVANGTAEELRLRLARRMGVTGLLAAGA